LPFIGKLTLFLGLLSRGLRGLRAGFPLAISGEINWDSAIRSSPLSLIGKRDRLGSQSLGSSVLAPIDFSPRLPLEPAMEAIVIILSLLAVIVAPLVYLLSRFGQADALPESDSELFLETDL
jgi:hypothetical protein